MITSAPVFETIYDWSLGAERLRARRYGVIETAAGRLRAIHLRPWPKLLSLRELFPLWPRYHARGEADRCLLYYNQPRRHSNFLALKYIVSSRGTSYRTFRASLVVLDAVAELKQIDAIVCDVANARISERLLHRLGWEPHKPERGHRNFIKRFYGKYPHIAALNERDAAEHPLTALMAEAALP
jgi:hypothetical protein